MALDPSAPLLRSPDMLASQVDGELVLISIEDGKYFGLDSVGTAIWHLLEAPRSSAAVIEALQARFEGDPADIERDTLAFIDQLVTNGLLKAA